MHPNREAYTYSHVRQAQIVKSSTKIPPQRLSMKRKSSRERGRSRPGYESEALGIKIRELHIKRQSTKFHADASSPAFKATLMFKGVNYDKVVIDIR